jgi:hypothetical protein
MKILVSLSKIPLAMAKQAIAGWDKTRYSDLFTQYNHSRNTYRIYLPLSGSVAKHTVTVPPDIVVNLQEQGYAVEDYTVGLAVKNGNPKVKRRIGALLPPTLKRQYDNDPQRASSKHVKQWVVISRHPYDLFGMSFDRGWKSCMNLAEGINKEFLAQDLKHGVLVAYLINDTDRNINNPTARVLIKPYYLLDKAGNTTGTMALFSSIVYGTTHSIFLDTVNDFCNQYNEGKPNGVYLLESHLYRDYPVSEAMLGLPDGIRVRSLHGTEQEYLDNLSNYPEHFAEYACSINEPELLALLTQLPNWTSDAQLRMQTMSQEEASPEILQLGITDSDKFVRWAALNNPAADYHIVETGLHDSQPIIVKKAKQLSVKLQESA